LDIAVINLTAAG